jgi:hypothetical protein
MHSPGAAVGRSRPNNEGVEIPTVCKDALDRRDQGALDPYTPIITELILTYQNLERIQYT